MKDYEETKLLFHLSSFALVSSTLFCNNISHLCGHPIRAHVAVLSSFPDRGQDPTFRLQLSSKSCSIWSHHTHTHTVHILITCPPLEDVTRWGSWNTGNVALIWLGRQGSVAPRAEIVLSSYVCPLDGYLERSKGSQSPITVMRNCNTDL